MFDTVHVALNMSKEETPEDARATRGFKHVERKEPQRTTEQHVALNVSKEETTADARATRVFKHVQGRILPLVG